MTVIIKLYQSESSHFSQGIIPGLGISFVTLPAITITAEMKSLRVGSMTVT